MPDVPFVTARCAAHPSRPAVGDCPVCSRPWCGRDALEATQGQHVGGCHVCGGSREGDANAPAVLDQREQLVRGALAANLMAVLWGFVEAEYVQAPVFQYLAPLVLGAFTGGVAMYAAGNPRGQLGTLLRSVAVMYAVLGCGFGFVKEGTFPALSSATDVLVPYLLAAGAVWVWTLPPKSRPKGPSKAGRRT